MEEVLEHNTICPSTFKSLVGRLHAEFSSARQQDACDYFVHLLEVRAPVQTTPLPLVQATPLQSSLLAPLLKPVVSYQCSARLAGAC